MEVATPVLTERDAARYLTCSVSFLRRARRLGYAPAHSRIGTRVVYRVTDLEAFLRRSRVEAS